MKSLIVAALLLTSAPALAASEREDAADILRLIVREEAEALRSWSSGPVACASAVVEQSAFDDRRTRGAQAISAGDSADPPVRRLPPIRFYMRRKPGDPGGRPTELEAREAQGLAAAVESIVAEDRKAPLVTRLESGWMTPPFRLCDEERMGLLRLTSPVIRGDLAFVSVDFDCVLCGHGIDFALRRRGKAWVIVAENMRWVS